MKAPSYFLEMVRFRPGLYSLNALFSVLNWLFFLVPGLITQKFFDLLSANTQVPDLAWQLIALLVLIQLMRVWVIFSSVSVNVSFGMTIASLLVKNLFRNILRHPGAQALPGSPGEAISRFRDDVHDVVDFIGLGGVIDILGAAAFAGVALIIMLRNNALITLSVFLPLVGVVIAARLASLRVQKYRKASRQATGHVTSFLGEIFGAVQAVKVLNAEDSVINHFQTISDARRKTNLQERLFNEILNSTFSNTVNLGTGLILLLASKAMRAGDFTVGDFSLFVYFLTWVTVLTQRFGVLMAGYKQAGVSFERMVELLQGDSPETLTAHTSVFTTKPSAKEFAPAPMKLRSHLSWLEARNLTYFYPGSKRGIDGVNFRLEQGGCLVITGSVGSGKTTLLRALLGLLPLAQGEIHWNGKIVEAPEEFFVPPNCAYTPQVPRLFSGTLLENILLGLPETEANVQVAISFAVLDQDIADLANGLATMVGPRGIKLSGGQVQRAAAARMFVRQPELLVFDDLSSALDVETEALLWKRLMQQKSITCLAVSHRRTALRAASHILVMRDGKVEADGNLDQLLETCAEMQKIWNAA